MAAFRQREAERPRPRQELQLVDVALGEVPVAVRATSRAHQVDVLVVADRLGGQSAGGRGFTDVHGTPLAKAGQRAGLTEHKRAALDLPVAGSPIWVVSLRKAPAGGLDR